LLEEVRVGRLPDDAVLIDEALEFTRVDEVPADIVEPDALAELLNERERIGCHSFPPGVLSAEYWVLSPQRCSPPRTFKCCFTISNDDRNGAAWLSTQHSAPSTAHSRGGTTAR